ncbi:hypothetical protein POM88_048995 [Heracleum sosnowskyi]|uniref:Protein kinase domain-containing protein n=1 Tax=Heracleum sosnowskyi TaxID=360622 RepID=A0AAD8GX15_9APIA|nr:hypothetical protein POM88_048995 [Heracleum sosnowskyi]
MLVAIKRADQQSTQGGHEFKTEIELLSIVHHKNVVSLVGFCFEQGEQMLVYEYIANGTLKESLSALGPAKGLQYLHDLANPPTIGKHIKDTLIWKSILNEYSMKMKAEKPIYNSETANGQPPAFVTSLTFNGRHYVGAKGRSKKESRELAARDVKLSILGTSLHFKYLIVRS